MTDEEKIGALVNALGEQTIGGSFAKIHCMTKQLADYEVAAEARAKRIAELEAELAEWRRNQPERTKAAYKFMQNVRES